MAELIGWGIPEAAVSPLLLVAGAPDEVLDRATADVEAHISARKPTTTTALAAVVATFASVQQASAAGNPATWQGIQPQRAKALGGLSGLLTINRGL